MSPPGRRPRVVVIGAGFAGLAAALRLAHRGADVTVLERAPRPGGKAGEWRTGGFRFDLGPSVLTLPQVVRDTFEQVGLDCPVEFVPADPTCRYVFADGRVWDVHRDLEATLAGLDAREGEAYRRALGAARSLYEAAAPTFVHAPAPGLGRLAAYGLRHGLAASPGRSLPALLDALGVHGPYLRPFFLRFATYVGADPRRAPAVLHNVAWAELGLGVYHPLGGMHALVDALAQALERAGVEVRTGATVVGVERRGARVVRVLTDAGAVDGDAVVSAVDRDLTLRWLGRPPRRGPASLSGLVLLAALPTRDERLAPHTVLFPERYGEEFDAIAEGRHPTDPTLYLNVSALADPADAPSGAENRFVMANAPALRAAGGDAREHEAEGRAALRSTLARRGFAWGEGTALHERWLGPSDFAAFGEQGRLYGLAPHGLLGALRPGPRLRGVANLWLAGGTVHPGGGVPLALLSGRWAAHGVADALGLGGDRGR